MKEEDRAYHAAMYKQNGHKEAINHLTILLESSPWSVQYLEARAECYEHRGMYDDAILDLRLVLFPILVTFFSIDLWFLG